MKGELNIKALKKFRNYMASGEWQEFCDFCMLHFWCSNSSGDKPCGCLWGILEKSEIFMPYNINDTPSKIFNINYYDHDLWLFLFSSTWFDYDNTVEGAIGRLDAVIDGLRF